MKTELRIGNWVKTNEGEIQIQNGWEIDEGNETHPIPLTEEWLERFNVEWSYWRVTYKKTIDAYEVERKYTSMYGEEWVFMSNVRYIHEFQNIYHALTGEELTIKEPNKCKYVKREGESCTLNDNCMYPNCKE